MTQEKELHFKSSDGTKLCGVITLPTAEIKGSVVLAHGITVEKHEGGFYTRLARILAQKGIQSLRFDFRGHGDSSGKPQDMTIKGEIRDLTVAVSVLKKESGFRPAIVGTSFGAGISVFYAQSRPKTVSTLVLLCPVLDYRRTFLKPETEWAQEWFTSKALKAAKGTGSLNLDGFLLGSKLIKELHVFHPGQTLLKLRIPVLVIHGTKDSMVPFDAARYYGSRHKRGRFIAIRNADHGFEGFEKRVYSETVSWIFQHKDV